MEDVEHWIVCKSLSGNVFVTFATQQHLEYHCKVLETPCIASGSHIEPQLSQVELGVFCYIMTLKILYMCTKQFLHALPGS
jgi:hypothetical protein